jgi:hypothetical protein
MLMRYFVRYRLSSCLSRRQGKSPHSWRYRDFTCPQAVIVQFRHFRSGAEHPWHRFFSRRKALQIAQSMPHGAMSDVLKGFFAVM